MKVRIALSSLVLAACSQTVPGRAGPQTAAATAPTVPSASAAPPSATAPTSIQPLPASACTIEVAASEHRPLVAVSHGFSPMVDGSVLPLHVTFARRYRVALLPGQPFAEIEVETEHVSLRAQAAFEDVRLFPSAAVQLTPWLLVRRAYPQRVQGDRLGLAFELPKGLKLTAAVPPLERSCSDLLPDVQRMLKDGVPWCQLQHRMLRADRDVTLVDDRNAPIGTVRVDTPSVVAVLEVKGTRAKVTLTPEKRDTMVTAWIDAAHLGEPLEHACKVLEPPAGTGARGWACKDGTPLTHLAPSGAERSIGTLRETSFAQIDANVCGHEESGDLVVEPCNVGWPTPGPGRLVVRRVASSCRGK